MQEKRPRAWENYVQMRKKLLAKRKSNRRTVIRKSRRPGAEPHPALQPAATE